MRRRFHYSADSLAQSLRGAGMKEGALVFVHFDLARLGFAEEMRDGLNPFAVVHDAVRRVLGPAGTLITPAFSYSFLEGEAYDPASSPCRVGSFGEAFRQMPGVLRSMEPLFSAAGVGPQSAALFAGLPADSFGPDSLFRRLEKAGALFCLVGADFERLTALHAVEQELGVPYRYRKLFVGDVRRPEGWRREAWIYNVRLRHDCALHDFSRLAVRCRREKLLTETAAGLGTVATISCADLFRAARQAVRQDPWHLAKGPVTDPLALERQRLPPPAFAVTLPPDASLREMVEALWPLPRNIVSAGFDAAIAAIAAMLPMMVHEFSSGTECFTWTVPERWECLDAALRDKDGRLLFSVARHPLHVVSSSLPFHGQVKRQELLPHLHSSPEHPDAIPFVFRYYDKDWGLCCQDDLKKTLTDDSYQVNIDTNTAYSTMKVGEIHLPGDRPETFVFCAHLCHPYAANDDLSGTAVLLDIARQLAGRPRRRFSYRFLVLPETIGSAAWLSRHPHLLPAIKGGLFLEMLGSPLPHSLQLSLQGNSVFDLLFSMLVKEENRDGWQAPYACVILNDERMFNAPGVDIPMASLSRRAQDVEPFAGYHTSLDSPAAMDWERLAQSRDLVRAAIDELEQGRLLQPNFRGELFCTRVAGLDYGRHKISLLHALPLVDGIRTERLIAHRTGLPQGTIRELFDILVREKFLTEWEQG